MSTSPPVIIIDSVTRLGADAPNSVVLGGSHCGIYSAYLVASSRVRAVVLNDAGIGRDRAGIAGLDYLQSLGIPAATISHRSARIGDGRDARQRGVISHSNESSLALGIAPGMLAWDAVTSLNERARNWDGSLPIKTENRVSLTSPDARNPGLALLDSVSLVDSSDIGQIVVTGSHGGLLGGRLETASKVDVFAALYNDADVGIDDAGLSRLPALDLRGIAAATVSAWSARIGDGQSTYEDGIITHMNETASRFGGEIGIHARDFVALMAQAKSGSIL